MAELSLVVPGAAVVIAVQVETLDELEDFGRGGDGGGHGRAEGVAVGLVGDRYYGAIVAEREDGEGGISKDQ